MKKQYDLSVIIPARKEEFLARTVAGVLKNKRGNTEVIVILDGGWADPPLDPHPDLTIVYHKEALGQRGAQNEGVKLSDAEFIMKLDAHCTVAEGFDEVLIEDGRKLGPKVTQVPRMYNLHGFNWKCGKCGNEWYQGPPPKSCQHNGEARGENPLCNNTTDFERVMVWSPRFNRQSDHMVFDSELHFQYWGAFKFRKEARGDIAETVSIVGACFVMNRERYWELGGADEQTGSWGQQGTEVSCKTWLSGGRLVVNKRTWFSHLFRTQGGGFTFPYKHKDGARENAVKYSQDFWRNNKFEKAIHPLHWLIEKFYPVKGWTDEDLIKIGGTPPKKTKSKKGIIYYTDNQLKMKISHGVKKQLKNIGLPISSTSLKPIDFGKNEVIKAKRGYMTMFKQILMALENLDTEVVFFCEHDVLYHPSHFDFMPKKKDVWYYNINMAKVNAETGQTVEVDDCKQVSGIVVYRQTAIEHYKLRLEKLEKFIETLNTKIKNDLHQEPFEIQFNRYVRKMGFEPGTHGRPERVDNATCESFRSEQPNADIRHGNNLTSTRWRKDQFRNQKYTKGWKEGMVQDLPGWEKKDHDFYLVR